MRMTADDLLIEARGVLPHRPGPAQALAAQAAGALLGRLDGAAVDAVLEAPATACHAAPAVPRVALARLNHPSGRLPSRASGRDRVASLQADKRESGRHDGEEDPARAVACVGHEVHED